MTDEPDITFEFASLPRGSRVVLPGVDRAILYHVRKGAVRIGVRNRPDVELRAGETASLPGGNPHSVTVASNEDHRVLTQVTWYPCLSDLSALPGGHCEDAVLFRSTISLSANAYPGLLPELVPLDRSRPSSTPWFGTLIELFQQTVEMPPRLRIPAQERLAELVATSVDIVGLEEMESAIAGGLDTDSRMRRALEQIHQTPEADWTLETLCRMVGASRSAFVARFKQLIGDTPVGYITRLRMYKAARLLRTGNGSISDIAEHMGYASEASFTKAFRRIVGIPPGRFRNGTRGRGRRVRKN